MRNKGGFATTQEGKYNLNKLLQWNVEIKQHGLYFQERSISILVHYAEYNCSLKYITSYLAKCYFYSVERLWLVDRTDIFFCALTAQV